MFAIMTTTRQFVSEPIACWCPVSFSKDQVDYVNKVGGRGFIFFIILHILFFVIDIIIIIITIIIIIITIIIIIIANIIIFLILFYNFYSIAINNIILFIKGMLDHQYILLARLCKRNPIGGGTHQSSW